uniref:Uncharacterized protein n=1 Tax=Leptobrachium leishanense TaxID=445787 RepID=A0A8C5QX99_9ANUR
MDHTADSKDFLAEDLLCPACITTYVDPISLSCSHSFCKVCIHKVFADQKQEGSIYRCPVCLAESEEYPVLTRNFQLFSIVENFKSSQKIKSVESRIPCNYCLDDQSVAVKTCITCEVSLCQQHLDRHTNRSHVMVEPTLSIADRKCPVHDKLIEFYCENDQSTVCVTCYIAGSHKCHNILTLKEAHSKHNGVLTHTISALQDSEVGLQRDRDELQKALRMVKKNSENLSASLKHLKANIISQVQNQFQSILDVIVSSEHQVTSTIENLTKQMKEKQAEAMNTLQELEKLKDQSDDLIFVKRFQTVQDQTKKQNLKVDTLQVLDVKIDQQTVQAIEYQTSYYINEINQILQQVQSSVTTQTRDVVRSVDGDYSSQDFQVQSADDMQIWDGKTFDDDGDYRSQDFQVQSVSSMQNGRPRRQGFGDLVDDHSYSQSFQPHSGIARNRNGALKQRQSVEHGWYEICTQSTFTRRRRKMMN